MKHKLLAVLALLLTGCVASASAPGLTVTPAIPTPTATAVSTAAAPAPTMPPACIAPRMPQRSEDCRYAPTSSPPIPDTSSAPLTEDPELASLIQREVAGAQGIVSVVVIDIETDRYASVEGTRAWYAASLYKLPLLIEASWQLSAGVLDPSWRVELCGAYVAEDLGTLEPLGLEAGDRVRVDEAVRLMVTASDNALAHLLGDLLGRAQTNRDMAALGATATDMSIPDLPTTAMDIARLLAAIAEGEPTPRAAELAWELLMRQQVRSRIPAGIPADGSVVGNKTGDYRGVAHDAALVRAPFGTYVLAILTDGHTGNAAFGELASRVHEYLRGQRVLQP